MRKPFIEGKKVFLRPVELEDAEFMAYCCVNSPDIRPTFFINFPTNTFQQQELIKGLYKENKEFVPFIICEKESGRAVGVTAFHRVDLVSRAAIYSIRIADEADWGKGFGTESTALMVEYGFEVLNLNRIQLHVSVENVGGIKAYERAGFKKEGLLRQAMYRNNKYYDFYVMGILREEYYQQKEKSAK